MSIGLIKKLNPLKRYPKNKKFQVLYMNHRGDYVLSKKHYASQEEFEHCYIGDFVKLIKETMIEVEE